MSETIYNFRVRATHTPTGVQADRDFSVRTTDTPVERVLLTTGADAFTSRDGLSWTPRLGVGSTGFSLPSNANSLLLTGNNNPAGFGGSLWIVWNTGTSYRTSRNGIDWNSRTFAPVRPDGTAISVSSTRGNPIWINDRWHLIFQTGSTNTVATSPDGINWQTSQNFGSQAAYDPTAINPFAFANGIYVMGRATAATGSIMGFRTTGSEPRSVLTTLTTSISGSISVPSVRFFNDVWFFVDGSTTSNARIYRTSNLSSFAPFTVAASLPAACTLDRLFYLNGRLILTTRKSVQGTTGSLNTVYTSDDAGTTWTARTFTSLLTSTQVGAMIGGVFGGYLILATSNDNGGTGGLRITRDGVNWTTVTDGVPATITGFARFNLSA